MVLLNKILVVNPPQTINPPTIHRGISLAEPQKAQLTLFSVVEELPKEQLAWITMLPAQELIDNILEENRSVIHKVVDKYSKDYFNIDSSIVNGIPFIEVIHKVTHEHYDMVVLASKNSKVPRNRTFGSATMHLMRKCPCPVWAVGDSEPKTIKRIVAAVDVYAPTEQGLKLNADILQWASSLSLQHKAELHVIHAWQIPSDEYLLGWGKTSDIDRCEMLMTEQQDREKRLKILISENVSSNELSYTKLIEGRPQEVIPDYIKENSIDLVVMGTVCRTGIAGFFIGNTAESILSEISCSVLTLKPEGYVSPVD